VGPLVVAQPGVGVLVPLLDHGLGARREELLLNVVSAITNLSYYPEAESSLSGSSARRRRRRRRRSGGGGGEGESEGKDDDDAYSGSDGGDGGDDDDDIDGAPAENFIFRSHKRLCSDLVEVLLHNNEEAVAEAARAFGNFSRDGTVRLFMQHSRADEALVILLDHASRDVVFAAAGALVNVGTDPRVNSVLVSHPDMCGCGKLVTVVRRAGLRDLPMAAVACKALYNTLLDVTQRAAQDIDLLPGAAAEEGGGGEGGNGNGNGNGNGVNSSSNVLWATQDALGGSDALELLHRSLDELLDAAESGANHASSSSSSSSSKHAQHAQHGYGDFMAAGGALHALLDNLLRRAFEESNDYEDLDTNDYKK
jgi:hypothetical protein